MMTKNKDKKSTLHIGTIHRKSEAFLGDVHYMSFLKRVLRLDDYVPCDNTEHNCVYIYENGECTIEYFGDSDNRHRLLELIDSKVKCLNEPILHDELFYSVYESEKSLKGMVLTNDSLHKTLVESLIDRSVKEKEKNLVIYFVQLDDVDENNMYIIRSLCVEDSIYGDAW